MAVHQHILVLLKRRFTDDAPYYLALLGVTVAPLVLLSVLSFVSPHAFMLPLVIVFALLPLWIGTDLFFLGFLQVHADCSPDVRSVLNARVSTLALSVARVGAGVLLACATGSILTGALTAAIGVGLVPWPPFLYPRGLVDLLAAILGLGLVSCLIGQVAGHRKRSIAGVAVTWLLVPIMVSLMALKGLGVPLLLVLLPIAAGLVIYLVTATTHPRVAANAAAVVILIVFLVPLNWFRYSSNVLASLVALDTSDDARIAQYYDFQPTRQSPLDMKPFVVSAKLRRHGFPLTYRGNPHFLLESLGLLDYFRGGVAYRPSVPLLCEYSGVRYDATSSLFVYGEGAALVFAGPVGVAKEASPALGLFESPVICTVTPDTTVVFDRADRCFYAIDFVEKEVHRGPNLEGSPFEPVDPSASKVVAGVCSVSCDGDAYRASRDWTYSPVVDEFGAVGVVDFRTRRFIPDAGYLPRPNTPAGLNVSKPPSWFDYCMEVIVTHPGNEYAGLMTASLARQGAPLAVALFDADGNCLDQDTAMGSDSALLMPRAIRYAVESLHPPALTLASFFAAHRFHAGDSHRAFFLMPNSVVAMQRKREARIAIQVLWALLFMLPGLVLAVFLSWRVARLARLTGISRRRRRLWMVVTAALGLPGYISYRFLHPQRVLSLCQACGGNKPVDLDLCPDCGVSFSGEARYAPLWRVHGQPRRTTTSPVTQNLPRPSTHQ